MSLRERLLEAIDYAGGKKNGELDIPKYTDDHDYGESANKISTKDVIVKASDTGNIYGRRQTKQRTLKKGKKRPTFKEWRGMQKI